MFIEAMLPEICLPSLVKNLNQLKHHLPDFQFSHFHLNLLQIIFSLKIMDFDTKNNH